MFYSEYAGIFYAVLVLQSADTRMPENFYMYVSKKTYVCQQFFTAMKSCKYPYPTPRERLLFSKMSIVF